MTDDTRLWDKLGVSLQYIIPQHLLSSWMYALARCTWTPLKNMMIRFVIGWYKVDMTIAEKQDYQSFSSFNDFFTRKLAASARPIDEDRSSVVSPVDGTVSQAGVIKCKEIFQAKGHSYSLDELLAGDLELSRTFHDGCFATLYLAPRDYHRIHMPVTGTLSRMVYVPGKLFSVNRSTVCNVPGIFSRNERVISIFQTDTGMMAVILVGAIFVGSMDTVWEGQVTPAGNRAIRYWNYSDLEQPVSLSRGEELGRFNMGSTVILLFESGRIDWIQELRPGFQVCMGRGIARARS